jgi:glycosyltransferase involved in cell wall biosynthesis
MNLGGVAVLLSDLHNSLNKPDFIHYLITGKCAVNEIDILENREPDSRIIKIESMGRSLSPLKDVNTFLELRRTLKAINPDIVHTHTSKAGVVGRLAALSLQEKPKIIHTFHGHHLYGYFSKFMVEIMLSIEKFLAHFSDLLVADSKQVQIDLQSRGVGRNRNWRVIAPGIRKLAKIEKSEARANLGFSSNDFVVSWVGRFTDIKNPLLALNAFIELTRDSHEKPTLIMVGDGELLEECKKYAAKYGVAVWFTGWESDIAPYLAASDLLLMTSKNEGFGMVIAEAGFYSVPTVSTDVGGVREFIIDKKNGILVTANAESIANQIELLIRDKELRALIGNEARKSTESRFTAEIFVADHKDAYLKLVPIRKSPR